MDPVNKWLTTFIIFMVTLILVVSWSAGSGRYEMSVLGTEEGSHVVYVLDTKSGEVQSRSVCKEDFSSAGKGHYSNQRVFKFENKESRGY